MRRINFILKSNNEVIIDKEVNALIKDNTYQFKVNDYKIKVSSNIESLIFKREDKDKILIMNYSFKRVESSIFMKQINKAYDLNIFNFKYHYNENSIHFSYNIENDDTGTKSIDINLL